MTRARADAQGAPTSLNALYYAQRASAGLIITESSQICPEGATLPRNPGIYSQAQIAGWQLVTDAVHEHGGRIFLQLWHAGRATHPSMLPEGMLPVAPSAIAAEGTAISLTGWKPFVTPHALELNEIQHVITQYAAAAANALAAGFDGVEVHAGNGFLIDQFLRDGSNRRTDSYGGSPRNRTRFLGEVLGAVTNVWPEGRVGVRISPSGSLLGMHDSNPRAIFSAAAQLLNEMGLAYLHVLEAQSTDVEPVGGFIPAAFFKDHFEGPIIANSCYDRRRAEQLIASGGADMVSFGRPFIANPDLPERMRHDAPLEQPDPATVYGGDHVGYTDYPTIKQPRDSRVPTSPGADAEIGFKIDLDRVIGLSRPAGKATQ